MGVFFPLFLFAFGVITNVLYTFDCFTSHHSEFLHSSIFRCVSNEVRRKAWDRGRLCYSVNDTTLLDDHVDQHGDDADWQQGEHEDDARWGIWENVLFGGTRNEVILMHFHKQILHHSVWVITLYLASIFLHAVRQVVVISERARRHRY